MRAAIPLGAAACGQALAESHEAIRSLREFRIRGVKTNIHFLENVLAHPAFIDGKAHTTFVDETPALAQYTPRRDRATRILRYVAATVVNGHATVRGKPKPPPAVLNTEPPARRWIPLRGGLGGSSPRADTDRMARRVWRMEQEAIRFSLRELGVPVVHWDGEESLDLPLAAHTRRPMAARR